MKRKHLQLQCFLFQWMSQQMLLHVLSCLFSWDIFIQETLKEEFLLCDELKTTSADVLESKIFFDSAELQRIYDCYSSVKCAGFHDFYQLHQIWKPDFDTRVFLFHTSVFLFQHLPVQRILQTHDFDTRVFLFHTSVRWLSKGNILNRVFVMKDEIKSYSQNWKHTSCLTLVARFGW